MRTTEFFIKLLKGISYIIEDIVSSNTNGPDCPITKVLTIMSAKWTVEILRELSIGPVRTTYFKKAIPGLSMKSLQERIRDLEKHGMLVRTRYEGQPARVEHTITPLGMRISEIMVALKEIANQIETVTCICPLETSCAGKFDCPKRAERSSIPGRKRSI
jgi:DNA-binding HxlR family transcriptional regulator